VLSKLLRWKRMIGDAVKFAKRNNELLNKLVLPYDDELYMPNDVPISNLSAHGGWIEYLSTYGNKKGMKILEIGSRVVTGSCFRSYFSKANYIGFDFYPGENVDVVGDAHKISSYFPKGEKFDVIFSSAVFEHLAMPWLVAVQISQLLKVGGIICIETHFSFSSHERPWHFFQYSDMGLKVLFSPALGFDCIEAGMCNPIVGRFSQFADEYLRNRPVTGLFCHSSYIGIKTREVENFFWERVDINEIVAGTKYPEKISEGK